MCEGLKDFYDMKKIAPLIETVHTCNTLSDRRYQNELAANGGVAPSESGMADTANLD